MNMKNLSLLGASIFFAATFSACGDSDKQPNENPEPQEPGEGGITAPAMVALTIWGEDFIANGIPADEFVDGWAVDFEHFYIGVEKAKITHQIGAGEESEIVVLQPMITPMVVDLASADAPVVLAESETNQGTLQSLEFLIAPIGEHHRGVNVSNEVVEGLMNSGVTARVQGTLSKGEDSYTFDFGFSTTTLYSNCALGTELGDEGSIEITIHGDHLFMDSLVSEEPSLRAQLIADSAVEGSINNVALTAKSIASEEFYQVGNLPIENLFEFIAEQFDRIGHVNGEGHCE